MNPKLIQALETSFTEARLFVPVLFEDERGRLQESYSADNYEGLGLNDSFVQDLVTWSKRHVLRGPHWDDRMSKFIQVFKGEIFDVIVDMRPTSPTYRKWEGFILSEQNRHQLYVPKGFAHGFLSLATENIVHYKMSAQHDPRFEKRIHWRDPVIGIEWPVTDGVVVSAKDNASSAD